MKDEIEDVKLDAETVIQKKLILKGDDIQDGVDFTHFNFLIHIHHEKLSDILEDENKSAFDVLKFYWKEFYPYLQAEIDDKENLFKRLQETNRDADDTVSIGMEWKFKMDHAEATLKKAGKRWWKLYVDTLDKARKVLNVEMERQQKEADNGKS